MPTRPGVGLTVAHGTPTSWRTPGSATLDTGYDPFDSDGALAVSRFGPEWAGRYTAGNVNATYATPIAGAEWEPMLGGAMIEWFNAGRLADGLPTGVSVVPGSFVGKPTSRELVDLSYHPEAFSFIAEWLWSRSPNREGKSAETPMAVSRPDIPWAYFTEPHVQYPVTVYFRNTARPAGEVSYSPARRQKHHITGKEFGPKLQAYPQVFGPERGVVIPGPDPDPGAEPGSDGSGSGGSGGTGVGGGAGGGPVPTDELNDLREENSHLRSDLLDLERLLVEIETEARTFRDSLPTSGGGRPLNDLRNQTRKVISRIMGMAGRNAANG